jgi:hypothetical protein
VGRTREKIQRESELSTFFRNLAVMAIAATLGAASASADVAVEVFTFTGQCTDCTGTGTGTLILLAGYVLGTPLSADDLYSFNYSSNLIPELSIHGDPSDEISGILPVGLGPANLQMARSCCVLLKSIELLESYIYDFIYTAEVEL